ncbi:MAG: prepilin peptidase [bacterium]|nr:prepilin peptidase [bacterium]
MNFSADMAAGILMASLLMVAAWSDVRSFRIPNAVSLGGALIGIIISGFQHGVHGVLLAAAGWAVGLTALMPLYFLRAMGAGDVKLLAMTGAFLGFPSVLGAIASTLIAGGVFALSVSALRGKLSETVDNVSVFAFRTMMPGKGNTLAQVVSETPVSGHLPYAVPILAGTMTWWVLQLV